MFHVLHIYLIIICFNIINSESFSSFDIKKRFSINHKNKFDGIPKFLPRGSNILHRGERVRFKLGPKVVRRLGSPKFPTTGQTNQKITSNTINSTLSAVFDTSETLPQQFTPVQTSDTIPVTQDTISSIITSTTDSNPSITNTVDSINTTTSSISNSITSTVINNTDSISSTIQLTTQTQEITSAKTTASNPSITSITDTINNNTSSSTFSISNSITSAITNNTDFISSTIQFITQTQEVTSAKTTDLNTSITSTGDSINNTNTPISLSSSSIISDTTIQRTTQDTTDDTDNTTNTFLFVNTVTDSNQKPVQPSCIRKIESPFNITLYRTIDGSFNNMKNPTWGMPNSTYGRLLQPRYDNFISTPRMSRNRRKLPNARKIRVSLFPTGTVDNTIWNLVFMVWGQFMAHDMSLLKHPNIDIDCCSRRRKKSLCFPIKVSPKDPTMGRDGVRCMNFIRGITDKKLGCGHRGEPAQQINAVTSWLDLSNIYGSDKETSDKLRSFKNGNLLIEKKNGRIYLPNESDIRFNCPCNENNENICYKSGDIRTNQNPQLVILQMMFVKEHNRIANHLFELNPHWNDERLFNEARRILIAEYQFISYYEWLPIILGIKNLEDKKIVVFHTDFVNDYDDNVDPSVLNEHAHAAFRFFHTHIVGKLGLYSETLQNVSSISLSDHFFKPSIIENANDMLEKLTLGMAVQNIQETDNVFVEEVNDKLFACGQRYGGDLRAFDIQRDRDVGLAYYNEYRKLVGLNETHSFDDFSDVMSNETIKILKTLYNSHEDVDLTVGASMENLVLQAQVGPTFQYILNQQFLRTRKADRFWFEHNEAGFSLEQLAEIKRASISRLFCDNGDGIFNMQGDGFRLVSPKNNPLIPCQNISGIDLNAWKEDLN